MALYMFLNFPSIIYIIYLFPSALTPPPGKFLDHGFPVSLFTAIAPYYSSLQEPPFSSLCVFFTFFETIKNFRKVAVYKNQLKKTLSLFLFQQQAH